MNPGKHSFRQINLLTLLALLIALALPAQSARARDADGIAAAASPTSAIKKIATRRVSSPTRSVSKKSSAASAVAGFVVDHTCIDTTDKVIPQQYLTAGRHLDILFNHQSIGGNIFTGLILASKIDWPRYDTDFSGIDAPASWYSTHDGIGSFTKGSNGNPDSKINGFDQMMRGGYGNVVKVAMTKLGVFDLTYDPALVWDKYRTTYLNLQAAYPNVTFVWFTIPVKTTNDANVNKYNTLVRKYAAVPANNVILYDIADIEADGIRSVDTQGNITSEVMNPAYSVDGVHLNDVGEMRTAKALWWLKARLAGWSPSGTNQTPVPEPTTVPTAVPTATPKPTPQANHRVWISLLSKK